MLEELGDEGGPQTWRLHSLIPSVWDLYLCFAGEQGDTLMYLPVFRFGTTGFPRLKDPIESIDYFIGTPEGS